MEPGDDTVRRRLAALLMAELDAGEEGDAVERAVETLREAGGEAERLGPRAVVAGFDRASTAVVAANRLHAGARAGGGPAWRAGIHVGEVIVTADDAGTAAAMRRAASLARLARPGTTAVEAGALPAIGSVRGIRLETAPPSDEFTAGVALVVPSDTTWLERRRVVTGALALALLSGAGAAGWIVRARRSKADREIITLGVGPFASSRTDPEHAWIGPALRGGLNTQLSELSGVKVYSQEFLDFLMTREGLSEIEVATRLGMEKVLSGAVLVVGDSVRLEVRIVDVASGILEGAYAAVGREEDFLALENEVVLGVIAKLNLPLSPADERRLASRRTTNPDRFRNLLDIEGGGDAPGAAPNAHPGRPTSGILEPTPAYAADGDVPGVNAVIEAYRVATEAGDLDTLAQLHDPFSADQRGAVERYFATVRDLHVRITDVDVAVVGEEAIVSFTRTDDFIDVPTGRPQEVSLRATRRLHRLDGAWRFSPPRGDR